MSLRKSLLRFGSVQTLGSIAAALFYVGFAGLLVRNYPTGIVGALGSGLATVVIITAIAGLGFSQVIYREAEAKPEAALDLAAHATSFRALLTLPLLVVALVIQKAIRADSLTYLAVVLGGLSNFITEPAAALLSGRRRFALVATMATIQKAVPFVVLLTYPGRQPLWLAGAAYFFATSCTSVYLYFGAGLHARMTFSFTKVRKMVRETWYIGVANVGEALSLRLTTIILGVLATQAEVGLFAPIVQSSLGLAGILYTAMTPIIPLLSEDDAYKRGSLLRITLWLGLALLLAAMIAQPLLAFGYRIVFGSQPLSEVLVSLRLLVIALAPLMVTRWISLLMILHRDYRAVMTTTLIVGSSNLILGTIGIGLWGIAGAGGVVLASESLGLVFVTQWFVRSERRSDPEWLAVDEVDGLANQSEGNVPLASPIEEGSAI